jgi:hypothetical protein
VTQEQRRLQLPTPCAEWSGARGLSSCTHHRGSRSGAGLRSAQGPGERPAPVLSPRLVPTLPRRRYWPSDDGAVRPANGASQSFLNVVVKLWVGDQLGCWDAEGRSLPSTGRHRPDTSASRYGLRRCGAALARSFRVNVRSPERFHERRGAGPRALRSPRAHGMTGTSRPRTLGWQNRASIEPGADHSPTGQRIITKPYPQDNEPAPWNCHPISSSSSLPGSTLGT